MLTGRKYKLLLTDEQADYAEQVGNVCRSVWNTALHQRREYRRRGGWMNYTPQAGELAEAKREYPWLVQAPSHVLQQTLRDLDAACREHGTFRVNWRAKRGWSSSFRFPAGMHITVERVGGRTRVRRLHAS
ncbi:MAG: helix-turn-helix domain-containing protein, partial [Tomitella sp.]|nr:helix-turn-helix domain-containing protein [Tomitella sp.]